jgi:hypothetical protein
MFIATANVQHAVRCVELSQTGLLVTSTKLLRESSWPYATAVMPLPGGHAKLLLRRVGRRDRQLAYTIVSVDDASQGIITDYLFDTMYAALPRRTRRRRPAKRVA